MKSGKMNKVIELHNKAMEFANLAENAKRSKDLDKYNEFIKRALQYESEAAWLLAGKLELEPSRSVLFRSAATLAIECGELRDTEKLISAALAGNPPIEIAEELRDLLEDVYFQRHLKKRSEK